MAVMVYKGLQDSLNNQLHNIQTSKQREQLTKFDFEPFTKDGQHEWFQNILIPSPHLGNCSIGHNPP